MKKRYDYPIEIKKALSSPMGFTLLIKGKAGTGKTTLALGILADTINSLYYASRMSPNSLIEQFPWLIDHVSDKILIDASNLEIESELKEAKYKEKLQYNNSEDFLSKVKELTDKMQNGTLIIDSWDAIVEKGVKDPKESIQKIEPKLMELVRQKNYNLVIITENEFYDYIDYLADGVIVLRDSRIDEHRIRTIKINKMRGVKCFQPEYVFSLDSGRFQYFPKFTFTVPSIMLKPEPILDPNIDFISTGIMDFDNLLSGGFRKGSWNLIETTTNIGQNYFAIILPLLINHLNLNRGVIFLLPEGLLSKSLLKLLEGFTNREQLKQQIINFTIKSEVSSEVKEVILDEKIEETFTKLQLEQTNLENKFKSPVLTFIGIDTLSHFYESKSLLKNLSREVAIRKTEQNITLALCGEEEKSINSLGSMVSNHWKLEAYYKSLLFHGRQPETEMFAVTCDTSEGYITTHLTEIV